MKKTIFPFCGKYCTFGYEKLFGIKENNEKLFGIKENNEKLFGIKENLSLIHI